MSYGRSRVETGKQSYVLGVHRADRIGFDHGFNGEHAANSYLHPAFRKAYNEGFDRGHSLRAKRNGGVAKPGKAMGLEPMTAGSNPAAPTTLTRTEADTIRKLIDEAGSIMWHDADVDQAPWEHARTVLTRKYAFILYGKRV